jgi:hypothetical protein
VFPRDIATWLTEEIENQERMLKIRGFAQKFRDNVARSKQKRLLAQQKQDSTPSRGKDSLTKAEADAKDTPNVSKQVTFPVLPSPLPVPTTLNTTKLSKMSRIGTADLIKVRYQTWYANSKYAEQRYNPQGHRQPAFQKKDIKLDSIYHALPSYELGDDTSIPEKVSQLFRKPAHGHNDHFHSEKRTAFGNSL